MILIWPNPPNIPIQCPDWFPGTAIVVSPGGFAHYRWVCDGIHKPPEERTDRIPFCLQDVAERLH